jgi:uncharacterized membrane protein
MGFGNYLDLQDLFINELAGSVAVFLALALIAIFYCAARFRMPNMVTIGTLTVFLLFMSPFIGGLLALVLLVVGIFFSLALSKIVGDRS